MDILTTRNSRAVEGAAAEPDARRALVALADVLGDLAAALATGRAEAVLAVEPCLAAAFQHDDMKGCLSSAPRRVNGKSSGLHGEKGDDLELLIRDRLAQCRRLGGTVPALMSVMFPGQSMYGRDGRRHDASRSATRPAVAQVI